MEAKKRLAGRFLPSRVYARWLWTVRACLVVLPAVLFLTGALTLYLSPGRYRSTTTFEYLGKRPLDEVVALVKSEQVINLVDDSLDLRRRFGVSRDTVAGIVRDSSQVRSIPATGMIELEVILSKGELSRDVAAGLVTALERYETSLAQEAIRNGIGEAEREVAAAEDRAAGSHRNLVRLISVRGEVSGDPVSQLDVDAARATWIHDNQSVLDARSGVDRLNLELGTSRKWLAIHTAPRISETAVGPKSEDSHGLVTLRAFAVGLVGALAIPYLLELAFPRRRRRTAAPSWQEAEIPADPVRA